MKGPSVLVMISSSGESPYLEIEKEGQEVTFARDTDEVLFFWVEGDPAKRRQPVAKFANWVVATHLKLGKRPAIEIRPFAKIKINWLERFVLALLGAGERDVSKFVVRIDFSAYKFRTGFVTALVRATSRIRASKAERNYAGRRYRLRTASSYHLGPSRMIEKLEIFLTEFTCPYLLLTTSTCYVNTDALQRALTRLPASHVYAGTVLSSEGIRFVAGNNILLSRDVVELVLNSRGKIRHDVPDDVALGLHISQRKIATPRYLAAEETPLGRFSQSELSESWRDKPVIRCKVSTRTRDSGEVISRLKEVHQLLSMR